MLERVGEVFADLRNSYCRLLHRWCTRDKRGRKVGEEFCHRMCVSAGSHRGSGDRVPENDGG